MPSDFGRIKDNVQSMVDQGAPTEHIDGYLDSEGFTPKEFKLANENFGTFMSSVKRGGKNTGSLIADWLPMMGADVLEKIAPESWKPRLEEYKQRQYKEAMQTQQEVAKKYPGQYESFEDVKDPLSALGYAREALGENLPSIIPSIFTGGVSGVVGKGAAAGAGLLAENAALQMAKQAALRGVPGAAEEFVSGIAGSQAAKAGVQAAARKAMQYEAAGALAGSAVQNMPDAYQTLYSPEHQDVLVPALVSGSFNSLLDAITPINTLRIMKNKGITPNELIGAWYKRGAKALGEGILTEGTTEALQEMSNAAAEKYIDQHKEFFTPENLTRFIDAGLKGGIGGGILSGATSVAFGKKGAPETAPRIPSPGPLTPAQAGATPLTPEPAFTPLTGERDLFGMTPEGGLGAPTEKMRPIIDKETGKITGYEEAAKPVIPRELEGKQEEFGFPGQGELFRGPAPTQPDQTAPAPMPTPEPTKPIAEVVQGIVDEAKKDPNASKILKGNNASTATAITERIKKFGDDPVQAMEALYQEDKSGKYPVGTKPLSEAQRELLETTYRRMTGRDIEAAIKERAFMGSTQGDLFGGIESAEGKTEPNGRPTPPDVGISGEQGTDTTEGARGPGAGGVGVGGGEPGTGGIAGGEGKGAPALTPEEAWNKHKNDDHPAYGELTPEEKAMWDKSVAAGRGNAVNFQDVIEEREARITRETKKTPEQIAQAFREEGKQTTANIEQDLKGKDYDQLLDYMAHNGPESMREVMKKVSSAVQRMKRMGYEFKFFLTNSLADSKLLGLENRAAGHVWPKGRLMELVLSGTGSGRPFGATYETAAHEFLHSVTIPLIHYGRANPNTKEGQIVKQLEDLSAYVKKELRKRQKNGTATSWEQAFLSGGNAFGTKRHGVTMHVADELVSWANTNSEFRKILESIPYKGKSAFDGFVEMIRKLIGLAPKDTTALSEVLRLTTDIFESNIPAPTSKFGKRVSSGQPLSAQPATGAKSNRLTGVQPSPTAGQKIQDAVEKVNNTFHGDWWTKFRIAAVDPASGLMKTLSSLPVFQDGQLRADMLVRAFNQTINLIKNGLQSGIPVISADGTVIIKQDENNLWRSQKMADALDGKQITDMDGVVMTGREAVGEVSRIMRGEEIMVEDEAVRAKAKQMMSEAKNLSQKAKDLKERGGSVTEIMKLLRRANAIRSEWREAQTLNREIQVKPEHLAWAKATLAANPEIEQVFDVWRAINRGLIDLNEAAGNLNKETADRYRSKKYYVPLFASRVDLAPEEQEHYTGRRPGTKSVAQQFHLEGSLKERNIWENMDKHYASATASAYQNQTRKVAVRQLMSDGIDAARYAKGPNDPNINLRFRDPTNEFADTNGIVHVILDNPNDLAAFQMMSYELGPLMKGLSATTQVLRAGALINPMYWTKQLIRDPMHAALVTNSGIVTPFHAGAEYVRVLANNSEEARILARHGVIGAVDPTIDLHNYLKQVGTQKLNPSMLDKALHNVMRMHEASDAATRVAIYKNAFKEGVAKGMSNEDAQNYAVHVARESINFAVRGNSKTLNTLRHMIPFFSASITSLDTLYRAATGYGLNPKEKAEMQRVFLSRAAMMAVMSSVYAMMMQDDEDYKKLPDNIKDDNWLLPSPVGSEHTFVKVPVPFEIGFMFKTLPEGAIRYMSDNSTGKELLASYRRGLLRNLPGEGVIIPQAAKPALEVLTNYSFFTDRPIEGMSDQGLPVEMRGANASEMAKTLSKLGLKEINLSPARIDHLIQGYFAELGTFSSGVAGNMVAAAEGKESPAKNIEQMPGFKAFLTNPNTSKAATDFYDLMHNSQESVNAFNRLKKEGRAEEAKEFISDEEHKKAIAAAPTLRKVQDQMSKLRSAINYYENNERSGSPEERRDRINELKKVYDRVANQGYKVATAAGISR